jgi:hypothetical protein
MLVKILLSTLTGILITIFVAIVLVFTDPAKSVAANSDLDFSTHPADTGRGLTAPPLLHAPMRDGYDLAYRRFDGPFGAPMLVLVHGAGWHGLQFVGLAHQLSAKATVLVPDLRGHGHSPRAARRHRLYQPVRG